MNSVQNEPIEFAQIAQHLAALRAERGLSQTAFARQTGLKRQEINYFETGSRTPSLAKLHQIAKALDVSLQRLLNGSNEPGTGIRAIAIELRSLGLLDLWVEDPIVPGFFRRPEEIVARAIAGREPEARIVEGLPAILAWNRWNGILLRAFAREQGRSTLYRLAWLAEVTLALEQMGSFPGGCPGKEDLIVFVRKIKKPRLDRWDALGRPADEPSNSPIWKRWRISYAANLGTFRGRAEHLVSLAKAEGRKLSSSEA